MAEHEKQPLESEVREPAEIRSAGPAGDERAVCHTPAGDWEGYSPEILSLWFDP
jgi:hypothetical protein